jgi:hypothetical protein
MMKSPASSNSVGQRKVGPATTIFPDTWKRPFSKRPSQADAFSRKPFNITKAGFWLEGCFAISSGQFWVAETGCLIFS